MHKIRISAGEEVGLGADTMIEEDKVLEDPKMDMAFAAHGWPSVESGKIGIVRRYAFGCVEILKSELSERRGMHHGRSRRLIRLRRQMRSTSISRQY